MVKQEQAGKLWSKDELKQLKKIYKNRSTKEVADQLGRTVISVQSKASELGLKKTKKYLKSIGRSK